VFTMATQKRQKGNRSSVAMHNLPYSKVNATR
jgi:hypothetical protein